MRAKILPLILILAVLVSSGLAQAANVVVGPGNIGDGSLTITGTGWANTYTYLTPTGTLPIDLATYNGGAPVAFRAWMNLAGAAKVAPGDWSKYYVNWSLIDDAGHRVNLVLADGNLGGWYGIPAQIWQRISLETQNVPPFPDNTWHFQEWYATLGGCTDFGSGGSCPDGSGHYRIYSTDELYYIQLIADPIARTFTVQAYGNGNGGAAAPPSSSNSTPGNKWWTVGTITVAAGAFNFNAVTPLAELWSSTQALASDTSTVRWYDATLGAPVATSDDPVGPFASAELAFNPPSGKLGVAGTQVVNIDLTNVANVYGYQFQVNYDALKVSAVGAFVNSFFDTAIGAASIPPGWNATCGAGVCRFAATKLAPAAPVTGTGTVAQITFTGVAPGIVPLTFSSDIVSDRDGNPLAHTLGTGTLTVNTSGYWIYLPIVVRNR